MPTARSARPALPIRKPVTIEPFAQALAAVREVLAFYAARPDHIPRLLELEDLTRAAARVALFARVGFPTLSAELSRVAAEALPADLDAALEAGSAMARWAAAEYYGALGLDVDEAEP